ncbi:conserved Plasmodium protein, unknown function [Plasmodium berghei]|uniref:Uncharacterized protein n=2 Tax=Plasmodium berghei TaxID=5821 RepID=A0A509AP49_PLABA|nr:conserved Plasmodium protein, unknown function [Plasmodium berghei ANKA]CXI60623.1 conserved Plasmodium protein, unknown function [Plasmodium berghei]SCM23579.1 conserved Plasmodium protein, unknown function [Plasmodium berghei]SCN26668.1 conserved Plasmodium protein, unknown function [Plasmodium berghei]SCO60941.1 conserved Plasmodium protein, unknown function [Plasmodium berghei]SCO62990.1 conserved Plasmodium protein, unknown function [Plasmodium berghei]|eukprot:XP_034422284.1 conserved Plasmodium protein, unknown function [Plasmodium berghei ANKA]
MKRIVKTEEIFMLIKIENISDINAVNHVKLAFKHIILDLFGLSMLLKVDYKLLKFANASNFFVLKTNIRFLNLFLYIIQPNNTQKYEFNLKLFKISNLLTNLTTIPSISLNICEETKH